MSIYSNPGDSYWLQYEKLHTRQGQLWQNQVASKSSSFDLVTMEWQYIKQKFSHQGIYMQLPVMGLT